MLDTNEIEEDLYLEEVRPERLDSHKQFAMYCRL